MASSQRRRPATRKGRPVLTREIIGAKALEMAGAEGFRSITMRALAAELGVTVRALYNYVEDRQEVIDLAVGLMITAWNPPELNPEAWEASVTDYANSLRELYRRWPRALLIALDEDAPPASIHPNRLIQLDRFLAFLRAVGLSLPAALDVHRHQALLILAFALMVDHRTDQSDGVDEAERAPLVPEMWLTEHSDLDIPVLREASTFPTPTPDEQFETLVGTVITQIRWHLRTAR
ncbi:TetR/AcrR family transcriptional regulator [Rhodococcus sp. NPDC058532]|uniref:TetR/AcrR family transcriptional regulator n=1 Tax=Rhodococcus sp. NPDC058532 TaxID=3346540 RepID=UPI003661BB78